LFRAERIVLVLALVLDLVLCRLTARTRRRTRTRTSFLHRHALDGRGARTHLAAGRM